MTAITSELIAFDHARPSEAWVAAAGFLARYSGTTRVSYASDLKCFFGFCSAHDLDLLRSTGCRSSCGPGPWRRQDEPGPPCAAAWPPSAASTGSPPSMATWPFTW